MRIIFDPAKDEMNRRKHGLSFGDFPGLDEDWIVLRDERRDYGEERFRAFGLIDGRPYCVAFTWRDEALRLISFRRAHAEEYANYGSA